MSRWCRQSILGQRLVTETQWMDGCKMSLLTSLSCKLQAASALFSLAHFLQESCVLSHAHIRRQVTDVERHKFYLLFLHQQRYVGFQYVHTHLLLHTHKEKFCLNRLIDSFESDQLNDSLYFSFNSCQV